MSFGQGGPQWSPGGSQQQPQHRFNPHNPYGQPASDPLGGESQTPDWAALADASATRARRKRWLLIGGGALAAAAVAGIVATAIVTADGADDDKRAGDTSTGQVPGTPDLSSDTAQPEPSFSSVAPLPPPDPKEFVSSADKDKAPLNTDSLFPGKRLTMGDRGYLKGATGDTENCAAVAKGGLGAVLTANGCERVLRATYTRDGIAVTVGVALFETEATAKKAVEQSAGSIAPLPGAGVPAFCKGGPVCRFTANHYGRYAYFTATGYTTPKSVTKGDSNAFQSGDDVAEFTFRQIVRRGEAQASAAATAPAGNAGGQ
ncbi:hypothetical protein [Streptomyces sp. MUM 178J]|uniref:hypothetical protein n=1 Tax=Streptomyces sp. MUM 178J TaxID=2791991 RepID=UPI001F03DE6D|nr:hypothetical protein [Streptomyces sp. MUM 178J]WRQ81888.1 hypothetical protein I3F59_022390 [Streptomyces sp. MUM 178J]